MARMTASKAINIVMAKGYESWTPSISLKDALEIKKEYPHNTVVSYNDKIGEIIFINSKGPVMTYRVNAENI